MMDVEVPHGFREILGARSSCINFKARGEIDKKTIGGAKAKDSPVAVSETSSKEKAGQVANNLVPVTHVVLEDVRRGEVDSMPATSSCSSLDLRLQINPSAHTGGFLWSAGHHLARWLFASREMLTGRSILELGCGLGLPALVAAPFAKRVVATDYEAALVETMAFNAALNGIAPVGRDLSVQDGFATAALDFTSASQVAAAGIALWDLILFTDCIFYGQAGEALPHALHALLSFEGVAVGVFPAQKRPGVDKFWASAAEAGLQWREADCEDRAAQEESASGLPAVSTADRASLAPYCPLFIFWRSGCTRSTNNDDVVAHLERVLGEPDGEAADVEPLFAGI